MISWMGRGRGCPYRPIKLQAPIRREVDDRQLETWSLFHCKEGYDPLPAGALISQNPYLTIIIIVRYSQGAGVVSMLLHTQLDTWL